VDKKVKVAIIGAGTAGLSAYKEVTKFTKEVVLIDQGPLGSTCARVGCMPSKTLIHIANQFHNAQSFSKNGISGADQLQVDISKVLKRVRKLRDEFTADVIKKNHSLGDSFICQSAEFLEPQVLQVGQQKIRADKIIIATGSSSIVPKDWPTQNPKILSSETIFEQKTLSNQIAVIGGGIIGLELGQALSRLGISISLYHAHPFIGGVTDPLVNKVALRLLEKEFPIHLNKRVSVESSGHCLTVRAASKIEKTDQIFAAIGRQPNLKGLGLEKLGIPMGDSGLPKFDPASMRIKKFPIYIAGDANKERPLLHEAADEGRIAGLNTSDEGQDACFQRRVPIRILFSQPNLFGVGKNFNEMSEKDFQIGEVDFSKQGRAKIMDQNKGILRIYASKKTGKLLGAEGITPGGEHLAHILALAIQKKMTASQLLQMPFYHPVLEEGMRTALRDLNKKVDKKSNAFELAMCESSAIENLS
jgi:dihydrolipoamide dehydrogenase